MKISTKKFKEYLLLTNEGEKLKKKTEKCTSEKWSNCTSE